MNFSWLTSYWRPKIKTEQNQELPVETDSLWIKCDSCQQLVYKQTFKSNGMVCPLCQYHCVIDPITRLELTFDTYTKIDLPPMTDQDPLKFHDTKPYSQRLAALRKQDVYEAIYGARASIDDQHAIVGVMDFRFIGGSMGRYVGNAIQILVNYANSQHVPLIIFTASGGARMQEGIHSLMQMPKTVLAIEKLTQPFIVVLTHPTMGGVLASFASLGDVVLAEPGATIGFSGRRVIENTIKRSLSENFQTAQFQYECGFVDQIISRLKLKRTLKQVLGLLQHKTADTLHYGS